VEKAQISKETKDSYVVKVGNFSKRYLDYDQMLDELPLNIKNFGYPVNIEKETVYMILESIE